MNERGKHFVDAFAASVLGSAAYDGIKQAWQVQGDREVRNVRVFQRALIIAIDNGAIDAATGDVYLQRVAALPAGRRAEYISKILQPPSGDPDDRQTALVVRDHAQMSDAAWQSIVSILGVDTQTGMEQFNERLKKRTENYRAETERLRQAHLKREEERRNAGWLTRFIRNL